MTFAVQNLIEGRPDPVSVSLSDSAINAFKIMLENDFSQLPVIDKEKKPQGLITFESILRTENILKVEMSALSVMDAMVRAEKFHPEDDLFELLDRLKDTNAVLIIDNNGKLLGIVTSYDTNEYFRRRSEDIMMLEDIESMLRELIMTAHLDVKTGVVDLTKLNLSINEVSNSAAKLRKQYEKALKKYMGLKGDLKFVVDTTGLEASFSAFEVKEKSPELDRLTLNEYNMLFIKNWDFYTKKFTLGMKPEIISQLLDDVRESRNQLAHFRGELSQEQREQIRFCVDWLTRHQVQPTALESAFVPSGEVVAGTDGTGKAPTDEGSKPPEIIPTDEEITYSESRYYLLAEYLSSIPGRQDSVRMSLDEIEKIIKGELPPSAYSHRSWWANDSVGHVQSNQWLEVDWRVSYINLTDRVITFNRVAEREKAYIQFFNKILKELEKRKHFPLKQVTPDGRSWIIVSSYPIDSLFKAYFNFSFSRDQRFRVELYIDTGNRERNKATFDCLYAMKEELQSQLDVEIKWERIDEKRASRVALYHPGKITDPEEKMNELKHWAVNHMDKFFQVFAQPLSKALHQSEKNEVE